jgi:peptidoglycan pentaglycine glycine transferase (the first glycine)
MTPQTEVQIQAPWVDKEWNDFLLRHPNGHLLQTYQWAQFKSRYGWSASRLIVRRAGQIVAGAQVLFRRLPTATVAYVPKGPVLDFKDPALAEAVFAGLHRLCRARRAIFLRVEPDLSSDSALAGRLLELGFGHSGKVQPRSTLILDIRPSLDDILAGMKPKTRYNIRLSKRRGVVVREASEEEVSTFYRLSTITSLRDDFPIHLETYYLDAYRTFVPEGLAKLFLADFEGETLGGLMVFAFGPTAWYMYGASSNRHRNHMPNHLLQWHAIRWAKERGCTSYDFWGIPDEIGEDPSLARLAAERSDGLWGVYRFKEGFGGDTVRYLGAYDYVYSPLPYTFGMRVLPRVRAFLYRLQRRPLPDTEMEVH